MRRSGLFWLVPVGDAGRVAESELNERRTWARRPGHHRLFLTGSDGPSGWATPQEMRLRLTRTDEVADAFTHVHEAHHLALNDSTAWGSLLHLVAAAEAHFGTALGSWVEECRVIHESYATFAALSIVEARFGPQPELLRLWPDYLAYLDLMQGLVESAGGPQRRYLLATVLARLCLQCPVGAALLESGPENLVPGSLRSIDRPDGRFRLLTACPPQLLADACAAGDRSAPGVARADIDGADPFDLTADDLDSCWRDWEVAAYDVLASALRDAGADVLDYDGHLELTNEMISTVEEAAGPLDLRGQGVEDPRQSDLELACSVLAITREDLVDTPYRARAIEVDIGDVVDLVADHSRVGGIATLVVSALLPERLEAMYRWEEPPVSDIGDGVVFGVRLIEARDDGESLIVWVPIASDDLPLVLERWGERGPAIALVTTGCLIDETFQRSTLAVLKATVPTFLRVDVPPDRLLPSWTRSGDPIRIANIVVEDTSGDWQAIMFVAGDEQLRWIVVGTEATVGLYRQSLETGPVGTLDLGDDWSAPLEAALTATLALETSLSFDGVEARL